MKKIICVLSLAFTLTTVSAVVNETHAQTKTKTVTSHKKKNALIGAVIGGAAGAGAGYLWGRHRDKTHPMRKTITKKKD